MTEGKLTLVRSSAGSGKTYTLVLYYLRIALLQPESFNEILAITFTNKATEEMKARLIKALKALKEGKEQNLADSLAEMTGLSHEEIRMRSRQLLQLILHRYSDLSVMTIDSFFYRLIRPVARELGIALNREIELDTDRVAYEIKQILMMDAGADKETTQWLEQFISDRMDENQSWNIDREISKQIKEIINDSDTLFSEGSRPVDFTLINELRKIRITFQKKMKETGNTFFEVLKSHHLSPADFKRKDKGIAGWFRKISNGDIDIKNKGTTVEACLESAEEWVAASHKRASEIIQLAETRLIPLLKESVSEEEWKKYITATAVLETIYVAGLAGKIKSKLAEYRDEKEILLLPDINRIIAGALSINDTNFVFEKTGNRFRHFLIDEFQDTSLLQWKNLLPLIENGLSSGGQTLVVGDAKQSIYRWRGGRMELLLKGINRQLNHYEDITEEKNLTVNYRSAPEIIEFNNRFFSEISKLQTALTGGPLEEFPLAYADGQITQQVKTGNNMKGFAEIRLLKELKKEDGNKKNKEDKNEELLQLMVERIKQALNDGFTEKDIAILTRDKKDASLMASYLFENGITSVLSPESLRASSSDKVQLILHGMKLLLENHALVRAGCLYFLSRVQDKEISHEKVFSLAGNAKEFFKFMPAEFFKEFPLLHSLPLTDLAEHLIRIFKLQSDAFVLRFQDSVLEFNAEEGGDLYHFIQWWNEHEQNITITLPETANAIRIMTIHKSKGLQFPVVLVPFAGWSLKPKPDSIIWTKTEELPYAAYGKFPVKVKKQLEKSFFEKDFRQETDLTMLDNINLLYVAFTRAELRLHVFGFTASADFNSAAGLIHSVLLQPEFEKQVQVNEKELLLETGSPVKPERKKPESAAALNEFISQPWRNRLTLALNKNLVSVNDEPGALQGLKFHLIMSEIILESDAEAVLKKHHAGEDKELKSVIEKLLSQCRERKWFSGDYQIKTECPLLVPDGSVLRPDRLMVQGNKITILDYKTGEENEKHLEQVRNYAKALNQAGYETVECYIYYTQSSVLKKAG